MEFERVEIGNCWIHCRKVHKDVEVKQEGDLLTRNSGRELGAIKPEWIQTEWWAKRAWSDMASKESNGQDREDDSEMVKGKRFGNQNKKPKLGAWDLMKKQDQHGKI